MRQAQDFLGMSIDFVCRANFLKTVSNSIQFQLFIDLLQILKLHMVLFLSEMNIQRQKLLLCSNDYIIDSICNLKVDFIMKTYF